MKKVLLSPFIIALTLAFSVQAEDLMLQSLGQGACWVEEGPESLKIASFNDRESMLTSREDIQWQVEELVESKKTKAKSLFNDLNLHCGGYGSSLVVKAEVNNLPVCLWLKMNKGNFEIRSLGGLELSKNTNNLCDGYKWEELIVGVKSEAQHVVLQGDFPEMIKSVSVVSGTTLKVVLTPEFRGRELEAQNILKKAHDFKYVELNLYQHPVGEVLSLK